MDDASFCATGITPMNASQNTKYPFAMLGGAGVMVLLALSVMLHVVAPEGNRNENGRHATPSSEFIRLRPVRTAECTTASISDCAEEEFHRRALDERRSGRSDGRHLARLGTADAIGGRQLKPRMALFAADARCILTRTGTVTLLL